MYWINQNNVMERAFLDGSERKVHFVYTETVTHVNMVVDLDTGHVYVAYFTSSTLRFTLTRIANNNNEIFIKTGKLL